MSTIMISNERGMISYYHSKCRGRALIFVVIITILGLLLIAEVGAPTIIVPDNYPTIQQAAESQLCGRLQARYSV